jgi:hypothetical protein
VRALELTAKIIRCYDENRAPEHNNVIRVYSEKPLTEEEWIRIYCPQENEHILGRAKQDAPVSSY